eukprot:SAG11_NODE_34536_length_271_cov_0.901163_1_plen_90_part_11
MELFILVFVATSLMSEFADAVDAKMKHGSYLKYFDYWNFLEMSSLILYAIAIVAWVTIFIIIVPRVEVPTTFGADIREKLFTLLEQIILA